MYLVHRTIKHDDGRVFEAGRNDLTEAAPDEIAEWMAIGWVSLYVEPTPEPVEPEPPALKHWEGKGKAPKGTWEHKRDLEARRVEREAKRDAEDED